MHKMLILVLNDLDKLAAVLDAWEAVGAKGVTIINSSGLGHMRRSTALYDLPIMPGLTDLLRSREVHHRILFTVADGDALVERLIRATKDVVGDFDRPNTGLVFSVPVSDVYGINKKGE